MAPDERLCAVCHGMKFVLPPYDPAKRHNENYKAIPCPANCNLSENLLKIRKLSQIKEGQLNWRLKGSNFHKRIRPHIIDLVEIIYSDEPAAFWYFHGPNGVGKSFILIAAINEAMTVQRTGFYSSTTQLLDALRSAHSDVQVWGTEQNILQKVTDSTIVGIDEIGRERTTEYASEKLFQIYNDRYQMAHVYGSRNEARITLLAGNYPPDQIEPYLQSRLQDRKSRIVNMSHPDIPDLRGEV